MNKTAKSLNKSPLKPDQFSAVVIDWQKSHGRHDLPWQTESNPYHVLVSELMLQQTQVTTVIPYFKKWLERFPTITHLANASEDEVLTAWQGLGYYSRARNLHRAAQYLTAEYRAEIPSTPEQLREIPGVGPYTAGAITAFAFDQPAALVDGNVKRLFSRYFGIATDPSKSSTNKLIWALAEDYHPSSQNRRYSQGLLDLGSSICKPRNPLCEQCPLQNTCYAFAADQVAELPMKKPRKTLPVRAGHYAWSYNSKGLLLQQRSGDGIWPRLWCLPELTDAPDAQLLGEFQHTFSHYRLNASVWHINAKSDTNTQRFELSQFEQIALPTPIKKYIQSVLSDKSCSKD